MEILTCHPPAERSRLPDKLEMASMDKHIMFKLSVSYTALT